MSTLRWHERRFDRGEPPATPVPGTVIQARPAPVTPTQPDAAESGPAGGLEATEPAHEGLPAWVSKGLLLGAALVTGFFLTLGIFVSLPAPGANRFDLRKRNQASNASQGSSSFQVFGPVGVTPASVAFSWVSPGDTLFQSYEVHYSTTPEFTPTRATLFEQPINEASANGVLVTGLQCETTYYFKIRRNERTGQFHDSREMAARTDGCPDTASYAPAIGVYPGEYSGQPWDDPTYGTIVDSARTSRYSWEDNLEPSESAGSPGSFPAVRLYPPAGVRSTGADILWAEDVRREFDSYEVHVGRSPGFRPSGLTLRAAPIRDSYRSRIRVDGLDCNSVYFVIVRTRHTDKGYSDSNEERFTTSSCPGGRTSPSSQGP